MDTPSSPTVTSTPPRAPTASRTINVTIQRPSLDEAGQRLHLFRQQERKVTACYHAQQTAKTPEQMTFAWFYLSHRQPYFIESQKLAMAYHLNARDVAGLEQLQVLFNHIAVVDELLQSVVSQMPDQRPVGWQLYSLGQNLLNLPTTSPVRHISEVRQLEHSLASTILQFFGVTCFSGDKGYFIGHILGYLFCCYYFAHLSVNYGVTPLKEAIANDYPYQWLDVSKLVRLLQETDETLKTQVYQLAVYAAQISEYAIDKRIEKMLISEVNSFNKQDIRDELATLLPSFYTGNYSEQEKSALFQPVKPLK